MGKTKKRQFTANRGAERVLAMKDEKRYLRELNDELLHADFEDYDDLSDFDGIEDEDYDEDEDDYDDYDETSSPYMS